MAESFKCEKCGSSNIMSPVKVEHEYEDRSDDEYPQWVVEAVKIGGAQVTAHVCLDCGRVAFSVDPAPLILQLKHEKEKLLAQQAKQKEENKIRTQYAKMAYEYKEFKEQNDKLVNEEKQKWDDERQSQLSELNVKSQINQTSITNAQLNLSALLQEQQKKQRTLKELGLSPETNPEIVKKLVDEYEALNESIKQLELEKRVLDAKLIEIRNRKFSQSDQISKNLVDLQEMQTKMRALSSKYPFVLK